MRQNRISPRMEQFLRQIAAGRPLYEIIHGRSEAGGTTQTIRALLVRGLIRETADGTDRELTEAGRARLARIRT